MMDRLELITVYIYISKLDIMIAPESLFDNTFFESGFQSMMEANGEHYFTFDGVMKIHGYTWEAVKVPTEDGYTLTTFHVTGKVDKAGTVTTREATEPPVLV